MALGIIASLVGPWAVAPLGWIVVAIAVVGFVVLVWRAPYAAALLLVAYVPYSIFHLIVQESYSRYALPIVPAVGYLVVRGLSAAGTKAAAFGSAAIVVASLLVTLPAAKAYSQYPSPAYAAINDLQQRVSSDSGQCGRRASAIRARARDREMFARRFCRHRSCASRPRLRRTGSAAAARPSGTSSDPARGDLELVDPLSRRVDAHYGWMFPREAFMSGVRPDILDLVSIDSPPGWFAETGWHLTPETLNISEQQGRAEGIAHIRNRPDAALLVLGGESTQAAGGKPARVSVAIGDRVIDEWEVARARAFSSASYSSRGRWPAMARSRGWWRHTKELTAGRSVSG